MDIKYFKDTLFDIINESDALDVDLEDIQNDEANNALVILMKDGSKFSVRVEAIIA